MIFYFSYSDLVNNQWFAQTVGAGEIPILTKQWFLLWASNLLYLTRTWQISILQYIFTVTFTLIAYINGREQKGHKWHSNSVNWTTYTIIMMLCVFGLRGTLHLEKLYSLYNHLVCIKFAYVKKWTFFLSGNLYFWVTIFWGEFMCRTSKSDKRFWCYVTN